MKEYLQFIFHRSRHDFIRDIVKSINRRAEQNSLKKAMENMHYSQRSIYIPLCHTRKYPILQIRITNLSLTYE